jgi:hypothetical protein
MTLVTATLCLGYCIEWRPLTDWTGLGYQLALQYIAAQCVAGQLTSTVDTLTALHGPSLVTRHQVNPPCIITCRYNGLSWLTLKVTCHVGLTWFLDVDPSALVVPNAQGLHSSMLPPGPYVPAGQSRQMPAPVGLP